MDELKKGDLVVLNLLGSYHSPIGWKEADVLEITHTNHGVYTVTNVSNTSVSPSWTSLRREYIDAMVYMYVPGALLEGRQCTPLHPPDHPIPGTQPPQEKDAGQHYRFNYSVPVTQKDLDAKKISIKLDPYRIASIYGITDFAQQTILKKVLVVGGRGHKDTRQDYLDIINAAHRKIEMMEEDDDTNY